MTKPTIKLAKRSFYCHHEESGEYDTISLEQNMEAPDSDHWLIELNLTRWRTKKELAAYLRDAAKVVESLE